MIFIPFLRLDSFRAVVGLSVMLMLLSGCALTPSCPWCCKSPEPAPPVSNLMDYWDNHVHLTPDPVHQGNMLPGVAGRVWLFGEDPKLQVDANGKLVVEMYDMTGMTGGATPKKLVVVTYDAQTLKQFKRKDMIGEGYTLFVPWDTYRPEITDVKLQVSYHPEKGSPHYTDPTLLTLRAIEPVTVQGQSQQLTPVSH